MQFFWDWILALRWWAIVPMVLRRPRVHGMDLADDAGLDQKRSQLVVIKRVHLDTHLGYQAFFSSQFIHCPRFRHIVAERFLAIDGLPQLHGQHGSRRMGMIRRGY